METGCYAETSVDFPADYTPYDPEDATLHNYRCTNLKSPASNPQHGGPGTGWPSYYTQAAGFIAFYYSQGYGGGIVAASTRRHDVP
jgi:hypothetical protein